MTHVNVIDNWTMPAGAMAAQIIEERAQAAHEARFAAAVESNEIELFDSIVDSKPIYIHQHFSDAEAIVRDYLQEDEWNTVIRLVCLVGAKRISSDDAIEQLQNLINSAISSAAVSIAETELGV